MPNKNEPLLRLTAAAYSATRNAYRRDRNHLVALDEPYFVGRFRETFRNAGRSLRILPYDCDRFQIDENRKFWLKPDGERGPNSDGATFAPDKLRGIDLACGYLPHDFLYGELENMAADEAWKAEGWTESDLRLLFDIVLGCCLQMRELEERPDAKPWISRLYYGAVRKLGGVYHAIARVLVLAVLLAVLSGCSGCADIPDGVFDPSGELPVYHIVPRD